MVELVRARSSLFGASRDALRTGDANCDGRFMPACSHQWRGRGPMARCIRCGKLKSDFRKEKHEQKMMAREVSESAEN